MARIKERMERLAAAITASEEVSGEALKSSSSDREHGTSPDK
jgi:hypothetical protein